MAMVLFWASSELLLEYDFHTLTKENEIFSLSNSNTRMMGRRHRITTGTLTVK